MAPTSEGRQTPRPLGQGLPRWVEAPLAAFLLLLTGPWIGLAGLAVVATSGSPVFFRQTRVGRFGHPFVLIKLRTMKPADPGPHDGGSGKAERGRAGEASRDAVQVTAAGDPRITAVGRFLRATKIDELPELWNVLVGEMSFVGPRPEVPRWVRADDPAWKRVLEARPGLSDPVTLRLRNEETLLAQVGADERDRFYREVLQPWKLRGYAAYLEGRTPVSDLRVLAGTLLAVVRPGSHPPPDLDELRQGRSS
ncbi:MAG: sugar transferase [Holophagales bacterium]|nr:sugar transferase [Holophagales bacterium]